MQVTQANYPAIKAKIEEAGFTGLPAATAVDWNQTNPLSINVVATYKTLQPQTLQVQLAPQG